MTTIIDAQSNPSHTFMDKKPPLLPRQSTSDVLSFTKIIADRLAPGQNVWDYFSPAPPAPASVATQSVVNASQSPASSGPVSPALPLSPTSPTTSSFSFFGNKRQSVIIDTSKRPPLPPSPPQCVSPTSISFADTNAAASAAAAATMDALSNNGVVTPKTQKRKSFAQSLRSMLSLSQLLAPSKSTAQQQTQQPAGPPHYNILVLGSDSAPLASTLYKMSSLLPSTNKISHYQEISGFFVAYFRSNGSFTCSPKSSTELSDRDRARRSSSRRSMAFRDSPGNEIKSRRQSAVVIGLEEIDNEDESSSSTARARAAALAALTGQRSSEESETTLLNARLCHPKNRSDSSSSVASSSTGTYDNEDDSDRSAEEATLCQEPLEDEEESPQPPKASANASLSVHAFSLDTTWPLPRLLAQTFWFPHAHGIIYIVDATRKNDPRGMDHLINARQFLSSLIADPHFKRRDIPVVVFANKAGMDDETCFRVDEIADILGCEEWDDEGRISIESVRGAPVPVGSAAARPWCVKSTRSDGEGEGLRESVEWLKSRMGEIWKA